MAYLIRVQLWTMEHRTTIMLVAFALGILLMASECNRPSGWYQGGGDSVPRDR